MLVYPFASFLAEFGGALGLFTGFSFMIIPDIANLLARKMEGKMMENREASHHP